jgi:hypothetical protein
MTHKTPFLYQKAPALHRAGKNNVERSLAEIGEKPGAIGSILAELLSCAALLHNDRPGGNVKF